MPADSSVKHYATLLLIVVVSLFLRLYNIPSRALGIDEGFTIEAVGLPLPDMFSLLAGMGVTPPLYYLLAKIAFHASGIIAIKAMSAVFGSLTAIFTYLLARDIFPRRTALISAIAFSIMPLAVAYGQHMRTYPLLMLLFTAGIFALNRYIKSLNTKWLVAVTALNIAILLTHYHGFFIVALEFAYLAFMRKSIKTGRRWIFASIITTSAAAIPWLLFAAGETVGSDNWLRLGAENIPYLFYKFFAAIDISTLLTVSPLLLTAAPLGFFLFALGIASATKRKDTFLLYFTLAPIALSFFISLIFPIIHFRYLSYLLPMFAISMASASARSRYLYLLLLALMAFWLYLDMLYYGFSTREMWNEEVGL